MPILRTPALGTRASLSTHDEHGGCASLHFPPMMWTADAPRFTVNPSRRAQRARIREVAGEGGKLEQPSTKFSSQCPSKFCSSMLTRGPFVLQLSALKTRARQSPCELNFVEACRTRALVLTSAALSPSSDIAVRRRLEAHTVGDGKMRGGEDLFFFSCNFEDRVRLAPE